MSLQKHWVNFRLNALGAVLLSVMLVGCDEGVAQNAVPQAPAVSAADVVVKSISQWDSFNGRIEAVESVQLRPRVSGYIDKVNYTDGQEVKKGEVLFTIDDRTYRAALEQAQATLARAKTQASLAQSEASRTDKLINTNLVSREEWEQRRSAAAQAQADIRAAQAAVDAAQLNLDFTKVTAPIDGRASRALITSGNLVTAGDSASVLTTLVSQKTVYVYFDVDESTYLHYQNLARSGQGASSNHLALPVEIGLVGEDGYPHQGKVDFLDNQLTPSTGTIRMRAILDNAQRQFTPGLFARVRLPGSAEFKATLIDDKAVLTDQDRKYVYIVDKEGKAQRRDITPGRLAAGLRIVQKGLNPGDKVIVDGLQKVFMPGMPVNAKTVAMTTSTALN
ncbi:MULTISPECIES: efflux RND transporter periplasmic adaptor subunit [Enterobacteriaceae]|jgi:multidrug efflux system membrane fusion protein|uniref:Efflux RND transporter periplasmic adaptor subunit n=2 Tax=Enterobacteriaceae TaxID=543 RepID=A0ABW1PWM5_9ENTR|nr:MULTISPECIES: efflux RND transporter periplasmic adaptor subunit [Enterobacteriaceae]AUU90597.1 efflux RND transporter periplasmic adaptor subunit [Enterobacteriaceae bacterium ENNIH3]AUV09316.1 efflux RND transporter periplasmic adaptor subunit [Enterobacteriaceae bacterium ENNIH2]MBS6739257.1 efflux RND transporter periplasmic adaptor subunit [Enterobacteriaceae bacterium]PTA89893.1 efflux RND transporter periplasmic adaptor subunit [Kluyvera sp. Nf5]PWF50940.1 efflux RND transporter peri